MTVKTKTQKRQHISKLKKLKLKKRGGANPNNDTKKMKMFNGILYSIKLAIARRMASLLNSQVTSRISEQLLAGLPPILAVQLKNKIDEVSLAMVSDMAKKGMDMGENVLKAAPGFGNAMSLVAAVDKGLAAMKNARESLERIAGEIEDVKGKLRMMGIDPDREFPVLNSLPNIPHIPLLDTVEAIFDDPESLLDGNLPSLPMPDLSSLPVPGIGQGLPGVPNVANVPGMPSVPNMNQLGDPSQAAALASAASGMPSVPSMGSLADAGKAAAAAEANKMKDGLKADMKNKLQDEVNKKIPGKPDVAKLANLQKGGNSSHKKILNRTKKSIMRFHAS